MIIFDSNAVLRYILQDNLEMADLAEKQILENDCFIPTEVIAEMVYVLSKVYKIPRQDIRAAITGVLNISSISTTHYDVSTNGLECFAETNLDFVDCLMAGYNNGGYEVFTFDKDLKKYLSKLSWNNG